MAASLAEAEQRRAASADGVSASARLETFRATAVLQEVWGLPLRGDYPGGGKNGRKEAGRGLADEGEVRGRRPRGWGAIPSPDAAAGQRGLGRWGGVAARARLW
eukprot:366083-Chlamydomonas_euryale.AAC.8